jgi:hypothetical protein
VDWGDTTTYSCTVTAGSGTVTGVTVQIGSAAAFALSDAGGGTWSADHVNTLLEVGASQTVTFTATADDAQTGTDTITLTVVDPFVALSGTHWMLDENTTIVDGSTNSFGAWSTTNLTIADAGTHFAVTESTDAGGTQHLATGTNANTTSGPCTYVVEAKKPTGGRDWIAFGSNTTSAWFNIASGTIGTVGGGGNVATITDLGDGWYRCAVFVPAGGGQFQWWPANANTSVSYQGDGRVSTHVRSELLTQRRASDVNERVGTAGNFLQATAVSQPFLWDGTTWSQASGLYFNGSEFMLAATGTAAQPDTVVVVWAAASAAGTYGVFGGGSGTAGGMRAESSLINLLAGSTVSTGQAPETSPMISVARFDGASSWHRKNGTQSADVNPGTTSRTGGLTIGIDYSAPYLTGSILDVAHFPGGLDATGAARIEKALAQLRSITLA